MLKGKEGTRDLLPLMLMGGKQDVFDDLFDTEDEDTADDEKED